MGFGIHYLMIIHCIYVKLFVCLVSSLIKLRVHVSPYYVVIVVHDLHATQTKLC